MPGDSALCLTDLPIMPVATAEILSEMVENPPAQPSAYLPSPHHLDDYDDHLMSPTPPLRYTVAQEKVQTASAGKRKGKGPSAGSAQKRSKRGPAPTSGASLAVAATVETPKPKTKRRRRIRRVKGCNCKNSRCLKLYCQCYAKQIFCGPDCKCVDCHNADCPEHEEARANAVQSSLDRNISAFFRAPVVSVSGVPRKGCRCKKSQCAKNYCECYQAGLGCMDSCRCDECFNEFGLKPARGKGSRGVLPVQRSEGASTEPITVSPGAAPPTTVKELKPEYAKRSWHLSKRSDPRISVMSTITRPHNAASTTNPALVPPSSPAPASAPVSPLKQEAGSTPLPPPFITTFDSHPTTSHTSDVVYSPGVPPPDQHCPGATQPSVEPAYEQLMRQHRLMARLLFLQKQQKLRKSGPSLPLSPPSSREECKHASEACFSDSALDVHASLSDGGSNSDHDHDNHTDSDSEHRPRPFLLPFRRTTRAPSSPLPYPPPSGSPDPSVVEAY